MSEHPTGEHPREGTQALSDEQLVRILRADSSETPLRPVWPHVQARLHRGLPRFDLAFSLGTGAAVTAGLLIGVLLGASPSTSAVASTEAVSTTFWSSLGSSLFETDSSLSDIFEWSAGSSAADWDLRESLPGDETGGPL